MTVHQVEDYYICVDIDKASREAIDKACAHIESEGFSNYDAIGETLIVDDIPSEQEAETLNDELNEILN